MGTRNFTIKFTGEKIGTGRISLDLFQKVLKGVQNTVYYIGEYYATQTVTRERGRIPKHVIDQCTLELVAMDKGSFVAELELPLKEQQELFPDIGENSLQSFINLLDTLTDDERPLYDEIKDTRTFQKVLRSFGEMLPKNDDYSIVFSSPGRTLSPLTFHTSKKVSKLLKGTVTDERELFGRVVEMKVVDERYFGILDKEQIIKCFISEDLESEVLEAFKKDVKVTGKAIINENGRIQSVREIRDIQLVEPGPWVIDKIKWNRRTFELQEPLYTQLDYRTGLWILEHEELGVIVCDEKIERAQYAFYEEFSMLWDEYAVEEDEQLTNDAINLKQYLINLVEKVWEE